MSAPGRHMRPVCAAPGSGPYPDYPVPAVLSLAQLHAFAADAYADDLAYVRPDGSSVSFAQVAEGVDLTARALATGGCKLALVSVTDPCLFATALLSCAVAGADVACAAPGSRRAAALDVLAPDAVVDEESLSALLTRVSADFAPQSARANGLPMGGGAVEEGATAGLPVRSAPVHGEAAEARRRLPHGRGPLVIMQSSGTTGTPKAFALAMDGVLSDMLAGLEKYSFARGARHLSVIPPTHAFGMTCDVLAPFATGGTLCVPAEPRAALTQMALFSPDAVNAPPALANALLSLAHARGSSCDLAALTGGRLRKMLCGGAPLGSRTCRELRRLGVEAFGCYGLTECSPCVAVGRDLWHKDGCSGVPLNCNRVAIGAPGAVAGEESAADARPGGAANEDGAPEGAGRIWVKGSNVMLAQLGEDASPQTDRIVDGWLDTGDLGRLDDDGMLWVLGRVDDLLVLADGTKVAPEPLERALEEGPGVLEALVTQIAGRLHARVRVDSESAVEEAREFAATLGSRTATRPVGWSGEFHQVEVTLEPLPRTPTGKLVRARG